MFERSIMHFWSSFKKKSSARICCRHQIRDAKIWWRLQKNAFTLLLFQITTLFSWLHDHYTNRLFFISSYEVKGWQDPGLWQQPSIYEHTVERSVKDLLIRTAACLTSGSWIAEKALKLTHHAWHAQNAGVKTKVSPHLNSSHSTVFFTSIGKLC